MPRSAFKYEPHPYLVYALNPDYQSESGLNHHNRLGLRGAEVELAKPAGTYRIICIGGSTTYTSAVDDWHLSYPTRLQDVLRSAHGDTTVEVLNAGVPGYNSFESLIQLELRLFELDPDLVVIFDALNDVPPRLVEPALFFSDDRGYRRSWADDERWWDASYCVRWLGVQMGFSQRNSLEERATRGVAPKSEEARCLAANSPRFFARNLESMIALCRARGVQAMLATFPSMPGAPFEDDEVSRPAWQSALAEHNSVIRAVAERAGVACFDFAAVMPRDAQLFADGKHVNERGALVQAELFAAFVHEHFLAERAR
jgi:lysophospholipase L1-like esterase